MAPRYVRFCLRISVPARDWYRLEDCVEERFQRVLAKDGQKAANRWARSEATWFIVEGLKRLLNPKFWIWPPGA
jgi:hypothetical protein